MKKALAPVEHLGLAPAHLGCSTGGRHCLPLAFPIPPGRFIFGADQTETRPERGRLFMTYTFNDIQIRTHLQPGDMDQIVYLHGELYAQEYGYGLSFEAYVAQGLYEFYQNYDEDRDRVWVCEHGGALVGFLLLMHRPQGAAQLRYFLIRPQYRGRGLGNYLLELYVAFLREKGYRSSYLWTTSELHGAAALYRRHGFTLTEEHPSTDFGKAVVEQRYDLWLR